MLNHVAKELSSRDVNRILTGCPAKDEAENGIWTNW